MSGLRVGVQVHPQQTDWPALRDAALRAEDLGVDTVWTWDHFFPLYGPVDAQHLECFTLLAALAAVTRRVQLGSLVSSVGYRNPHLLADVARTTDRVSGGRFTLGVGAGWFARDYEEYGYGGLPEAPERARLFREAVPQVVERLARLNPGPVHGHLPLLVGGGGEQVTLKVAAQHADEWNFFWGDDGGATWRRQDEVLRGHLADAGRDGDALERSVLGEPEQVLTGIDAMREAGVTHVIMALKPSEADWESVERLVAARDDG